MPKRTEADINDRLPGNVYFVPDKFWGFRAVGRDDHPGVCLFCFAECNSVMMSKGTGASSKAMNRSENPYLVFPTKKNGLTKETAFDLVPKRFRLHRVLLLEPERKIGELDEADRKAMQDELRRIFQVDRKSTHKLYEKVCKEGE